MGFGVWGLGFTVWGLGFGVWGLGFWDLGFRVLEGFVATLWAPGQKKSAQGHHKVPGHSKVMTRSWDLCSDLVMTLPTSFLTL